MLQHLLIKDLAIVAFADIAFETGMTVITGETGAGKSILLDALGLALGERAESQLIRPGAEKAEIAATFDISSLPGAVLWLTECELATDPSSQCIIRRIIYNNGRSRAFINGNPVTTHQLKLLGDYLVQIHGQHQHQQLLKTTEQLRLLDAFGQCDSLLSQVKTSYKTWEKLAARQQFLLTTTKEQQAASELLNYQLTELETLNLQENELATLYAEHDQLAHAQNYLKTCDYVLALLDNQEENNTLVFLAKAQSTLESLLERTPLFKNAFECIENANIQVKEAINELNAFGNRLEINPERLSGIEKRLEKIHETARKHKVAAEELYAHYHTLLAQRQTLDEHRTELENLEQDLRLAQMQYQQVAKALTQARSKACQLLAEQVTTCIQQVGLPGALFTAQLIAHEENTLHANGNETVLFGISANPGHPPQALHKVASGGELSRISLALQLIISKSCSVATPCLIFDEVDVGISGKIGALVGQALYDLGKSTQTICITHLPQVAAFGNQHLQVTKTRHANSTTTEIHPLKEKERIEEIARMLGGLDITAQAKAHAKQLLNHHQLAEA